MTAQAKLLVVEDDADLRDSLKELLQDQYRVISASDGEEGLALALRERPNAIILDVLMPKRDGFAVVSALRKDNGTRHIPVLMLTALGDLENRLKAFELGADDFLSKPFEPNELLVRIAAKLRREKVLAEDRASSTAVRCGNLQLDTSNVSVSIDDRSVKLSLLEFNLLKYLLKHKNKLRTRKQILTAVWKDPSASERLLDPHMMIIRRKLEGFDHEIAAIYGGGYILRPREGMTSY